MRKSGSELDRVFKITAATRPRSPPDKAFFDRLAVSVMRQCGLSRELAAKRVRQMAISAQPGWLHR